MQTYIRDSINYYNDLLLNKHLSSTKEALLQFLKEKTPSSSLNHQEVCKVLRPFFTDKSRYDSVKQASLLVTRAINSLTKEILKNSALRKELALSSLEESVLETALSIESPNIISRFDGFLSEGENLNFIEYNLGALGGYGNSYALSEFFSKLPIMEEFSKRYHIETIAFVDTFFDEMLKAYHSWGGKGLPNIAIVNATGVLPLNLSHFLALEKKGCKVKIAQPKEFELKNNKLFIADFPLDLIYIDMFLWDFLTKIGLKHPIAKAVKQKAVCPFYWLQIIVLSRKSIFAFLSDEKYSHLFDKEIQQALANYIPWTRTVRESKTSYKGKTIDLLPFVANNRQNFILKPSLEYGGKGVVIGKDVDDSLWSETLKTALNGSYVVQEYVAPPKDIYPSLNDNQELSFEEFLVDFNPYIWRLEKAECFMVRLSKSSILNTSAGWGSITPPFILSPKE